MDPGPRETPTIDVRPGAVATIEASPTRPRPASPTPIPVPVLEIIGDEETVFDWSTDRCEAGNIPDLAFRAFRDGQGLVQAILSHGTNYRLRGPDLENLTLDCQPVMRSGHDPDPARYMDAEWIAAPYTEDGRTIYALVHNEYQGHRHPGQCPQNDYFPCWDNSITLAVSTDVGESYAAAQPPPGHLVARFPYQYLPGAGPEGFRSPSNIIKGQDGYFYSLFHVSEFGTQVQWTCLMRTDDLSQPAAWRFWDGTDFAGRFADPYGDEIEDARDHICAPLDQDNIGTMHESITYHTTLDRYVLVGISADWLSNREVWGFYYAFSEDLVHWTRRELLVEIALPWTVASAGSDRSYLYPSLLDPDSNSRNFETTDDTAFLYYTRHNFGQGSLDRDLVRVPVQFSSGPEP